MGILHPGRIGRPFFLYLRPPMMMPRKARSAVAAFLLSVLLAAYAGQKVHIYLEDHAHFAAFCGDLVPDNQARESVVEQCPVDDFPFYSYLEQPLPEPVFHAVMLGVLYPEATRCANGSREAYVSLRAPPAG